MVSHYFKVGSTTRGAQTSREKPRDRAPLISSSANRAPATRMNEPFRAPCIDHRNAQSSTADDPQTLIENIETQHHAEVADHELGDEDYDPETDEVPSFDDHIDNLFAAQEVEGQHNNKKAKDTDFWEVTIIEDGVRKLSKVSVKEAIVLPSNTKIVLPFNSELQPIGQAAGLLSGFIGSLGADYSQFPIHLHSWKLVSKAKREHVYDILKEAIANVERQDGSSKHLSQNDSLAQVLGKEHPGRVRALGAGPCPTQVFGNTAGQPSGFAESNTEDKMMIAELTAKLEEERAKRQSIHKVLGYVVQ
ncbi:hypothetical protein Ahy_B09g099038 [Arachis hypogaea]|uniref:Uncharacterized protein n=1 Tax=Arachis hypogaea TaxID=3818 RepID=A0A444XSP5_ARAHY|nr:hypothetical protein Ahy_B09g099038 [Arachis hypogaea]